MSKPREPWQQELFQRELEHLKLQAERSFEDIYKLGIGQGRSMEWNRLKQELQKYEKDSVVAKILLEKFSEEER